MREKVGGEMAEDIYIRLAHALDRLPNGFPRTQSGVEIAILKRFFTLEEASIACTLGREFEPYNEIARRVGLREEEARSRLDEMAERGLLGSRTQDGKPYFRLNPFVVGIYESGLEDMDHELAHLVERYFAEGGAAGIMGPEPAIHRVIPTHGAVKSEWILPYDDVKAIIKKMNTFNVRRCICRVQQDQIGRRCDFPLDICLNFSSRKRSPTPGDISKDEAMTLLDRAEDLGLVHTVSNVMEGFGYVCNCCGCCCGILRGITDWGIESSVAHANYYSEIDPDECVGCGVCVDRCQVKAVSMENGRASVDRRRCIGCGLCTTKCPSGAARLIRKPENEIVHPPADFDAWEKERLRNRGLSE